MTRAEEYAARKGEGLCQNCSKKAVPGKTRCAECAARDNAEGTRRAHARRDHGLCWACPRPAVFNYTFCQIHLDKMNARYRAKTYVPQINPSKTLRPRGPLGPYRKVPGA